MSLQINSIVFIFVFIIHHCNYYKILYYYVIVEIRKLQNLIGTYRTSIHAVESY